MAQADGTLKFDTALDSTKFKSGLSKISSLATKAVAGVAAGLGALGAAAVKVGADFEAGMSEVEAISGATGSELDALAAKAKEMGAATKFSATESAEALKYMAMAGWDTQSMLDGLPGIMNLAAASGENLATVSDIVTDDLTAFGLSAKDAGHFADVLAKASSSSNTNVSLMGATFKYAAPLAGTLGYSIEDVAIATGLMANASIKGEQAGTSLRAMFTRLASPPKDAAEALNALGISMTDANGQVKPLRTSLKELRAAFSGLSQQEQAQMASSIAGQEAMSGFLAIINASDEDFDKLASSIDNATGAAEHQAEVMNDNLKGQIKIMQSALEGLGIEFYESVQNPLKDVVKNCTGYIDDLANAFRTGGIDGLVTEMGNVFADAATRVAEAAPCMIEAAVSFIQSFVEGIKKNKTRIYKAALEIASTLGEGLTKLLPKSLQKPVADAINALKKSFESGGLKKAIQSVGKLLKGFGDAAGNLAKVVLPVLTKAVDFLGKNMDILAPAALAVIAALKGLSIAKTVSTGIAQLTTMITKATEAAGAAKTASSGIAALATAAKGAASSSAGLGGVLTTMIGPQGLFVIGAAAAAALGAAIYKSVTAESEKARQKMESFCDTMTDFHAGLQTAESHLSTFDAAFSGFNAQQSEVEATITEVQSNITAILQKGMTDRDSITSEDLINLQTYYAQLDELHAEMLTLEQQKTDAVTQIEVQRAASSAGTAEQIIAATQESVATLQEQINKESALMAEQLATETVNSQNRIGVDRWTQEKHAAWLAARVKSDEDHLADLQANLGAILAAGTENYKAQILQDANFAAAVDDYHVRMAEENQQYRNKLAQIDDNAILSDYWKNKQKEAAEEAHIQTLSKYWTDLTNNLSGEQNKQLATLIQLGLDTDAAYGELEVSTETMIRDMIKSWEGLEPKVKDSMRDTYQAMLDEMQLKSPGLYKKMSETGDSLISALNAALGVASPSWKTRQTMDYVMQGAEQGLEGRRPSLLGKAQSIAASVISTISNAFKVRSPSRVMEDIFGYVMEGAEQGLAKNEDALLATAAGISDDVRAQLTPDAIDNFVSQAQAAIGRMHSASVIRMSALANYQAAAAEPYNPQINATFGGTVVVPVEIEGREVARVTAPFMGEQLAFEEG